MSEEVNKVSVKWDELKAYIEDLELDVAKNSRGVVAAGVRVRKGLRTISKTAGELVKITKVLDAEHRATKAAEKAEK